MIVSIFLSLNFANYTGKLIVNYDAADNPVLGGYSTILSVLAIFAVIACINYLLTLVLYNREKFLAHILSCATPVIGILLFFVLGAIKSLN